MVGLEMKLLICNQVGVPWIFLPLYASVLFVLTMRSNEIFLSSFT